MVCSILRREVEWRSYVFFHGAFKEETSKLLETHDESKEATDIRCSQENYNSLFGLFFPSHYKGGHRLENEPRVTEESHSLEKFKT